MIGKLFDFLSGEFAVGIEHFDNRSKVEVEEALPEDTPDIQFNGFHRNGFPQEIPDDFGN